MTQLNDLKLSLKRTFSVLLHGGYDARELNGVLETLKEVDKLVDSHEQLQKRFEEAVEVIKFYADEDGGPYAAGDYHTADGGETALNFLRSLDKEK